MIRPEDDLKAEMQAATTTLAQRPMFSGNTGKPICQQTISIVNKGNICKKDNSRLFLVAKKGKYAM